MLPEQGTHHGFTGVPSADSRIDWLLASEHFVPVSGDVLHYEEGGRYPSDHFPLVTTFELTSVLE